MTMEILAIRKNPEDSFMTDETMKTFEKIPHEQVLIRI